MRILAAAAAILLCACAGEARADDFNDSLDRINDALRKNPGKVTAKALESCFDRRNFATQLYYAGHAARAERSLKYCFQLLEIPEQNPPTVDRAELAALAMAKKQAEAAREIEQALSLAPDIEDGLEIYRTCAECHTPEGWGLTSGLVPQLAGQHRRVVIKQLADIRAGNRDSVLMIPYSSLESIGGAQAIADVAGYIDTLEISVETGKGSGEDLELGKKLYAENCTRCHGPTGEGNAEDMVPRIQSQHYNYLVRQFRWIRDGRRRNANNEMVVQIQNLKDREVHAILDYVSRLAPPPEFQAPPNWRNPDFAD